MYKNTLIAGLTLLSICFATASSTRAELARDVNSLTIKSIERSTTNRDRSNQPQQDNPNQTQQERNTQPQERNSQSQERNNQPQVSRKQQSMRYVQLGWAAQKRGQQRQALIYYYQAVKLDQTNAVAFLAAGNLLGETEEGITCVKAAVTLFRSQGNREGYDIARNWLEGHGAGY
jgi:tetratricopeptide (TPR) repeat protein